MVRVFFAGLQVYAQVSTVAFEGIEAKRVDVQVQITAGRPSRIHLVAAMNP